MKKLIIIGLVIVLMGLLSLPFLLNYQKKEKQKELVRRSTGAFPTITLSSNIDSGAAVDAILALREHGDADSLSVSQKNIISEIDQKTQTLLSQEKVSSDESSEATNDTIVLVKDSVGNYLEPQITQKLADLNNKSKLQKLNPFDLEQASAAYEANFAFDKTVSADIQAMFTKAYGEILAVYGPRAYSYILTDTTLRNKYAKIFVQNKANPICGTLNICFSVVDNAIFLNPNYIIDYALVAHELTHAFHAPFILNDPLWEEGFTETVMRIIADEGQKNYYGQVMEINNLPHINYYYHHFRYDNKEPIYSDIPYFVGSALAKKIYLEDSKFFLKFNDAFYKKMAGPTFNNNHLLWKESDSINLVSSVIPTIEGLPSWEWFVNYFVYRSEKEPDPSINILIGMPGPTNYNITRLTGYDYFGSINLYTGWANEANKINSLKVEFYDYDNKLIGQFSPTIVQNKSVYIYGTDIFTNKDEAINYEGVLKIVATINGDPLNKREFYAFMTYFTQKGFCKGGTYQTNGRYAFVIGKASAAKLSRLNSTGAVVKSWDGQVKNGLICFPYNTDPDYLNPGKFKVDVTVPVSADATSSNTSTSKIVTHYYNQPFTDLLVPVVRTKAEATCNNCQGYRLLTKVENSHFFSREWTNIKATFSGTLARIYSALGPTGWGEKSFLQK